MADQISQDNFTAYISDPTQSFNDMTIIINDKPYYINLPVDEYRGASIKVTVNK